MKTYFYNVSLFKTMLSPGLVFNILSFVTIGLSFAKPLAGQLKTSSGYEQDVGKCTEIKQCARGQHAVLCSGRGKGYCVPCKPGTWQPYVTILKDIIRGNNSSCKKKKKCDYYLHQSNSTVDDNICRCPHGMHLVGTYCVENPICKIGQGQTKKGICETCPQGSFSDVKDGYQRCKPSQRCKTCTFKESDGLQDSQCGKLNEAGECVFNNIQHRTIKPDAGKHTPITVNRDNTTVPLHGSARKTNDWIVPVIVTTATTFILISITIGLCVYCKRDRKKGAIFDVNDNNQRMKEIQYQIEQRAEGSADFHSKALDIIKQIIADELGQNRISFQRKLFQSHIQQQPAYMDNFELECNRDLVRECDRCHRMMEDYRMILGSDATIKKLFQALRSCKLMSILQNIVNKIQDDMLSDEAINSCGTSSSQLITTV